MDNFSADSISQVCLPGKEKHLLFWFNEYLIVSPSVLKSKTTDSHAFKSINMPHFHEDSHKHMHHVNELILYIDVYACTTVHHIIKHSSYNNSRRHSIQVCIKLKSCRDNIPAAGKNEDQEKNTCGTLFINKNKTPSKCLYCHSNSTTF